MPNARDIGVGSHGDLPPVRDGARRLGVKAPWQGLLAPGVLEFPIARLRPPPAPADGIGNESFDFLGTSPGSRGGGWLIGCGGGGGGCAWAAIAACTAALKRAPRAESGAPPPGWAAQAAALKRAFNSSPRETSIGMPSWAANWLATGEAPEGTCCATWKGPKSTSGAHSPGPWVYMSRPLHPSLFTAERMWRSSSRGGTPLAFQDKIARNMKGNTTRSNAACGICCISFTYKIAVLLLHRGTRALVSAMYSSTEASPRK
mmetsp:Transcript_29594/g.74332  ORF Transcript_29594/g.74332 Transcript_29594/m.74332 type:complete len:260 (-) Transcript_29594:698-1477(-)